MYLVRLSSETDFAGWRAAARALRLNAVAPEAVAWRVGAASGLFHGEAPPPAPEGQALAAPRAFLDLAADAVPNRAEGRFALLYRLLWRLRETPRLMEISTDADVALARSWARQVRDAEHKMHAFLRFRRIDAPEDELETYVAWFEPAHRVVERAATFFVERMANLRFSILTPEVCAHWDGALSFTAGVDRSEAPDDDALEACWRTYFASVFNPARLNPGLMTQHMPRRYWRNLPEAAVIPGLVQTARERTKAMVEAPAAEPSPRVASRARRRPAAAAPPPPAETPATLQAVAAGVQACRRCELWASATQGVPGEGPARAALMFVGEQPGDIEDLKGRPFVGPAGQLLDRALAEAGVPREEAYVTNAVKHFKWEPRGKRRLHARPNASEITACRWWLDRERAIVRPKVVVALGATAALSVFGRSVSVTRERGPAGQIDSAGAPGEAAAPDEAPPDEAPLGFVTVHPSYLLRLPDEAAKADEFTRFVADLAQAWTLAQAA